MTTGLERLSKIVHDCFGDDAERLIDANAVLPLWVPGSKAGPIGWPSYDLSKTPAGFHSVALINGERSGVTVIDVDTKELDGLPPDPNVTTAKGAHYFIPYMGEQRRHGVIEKVDVLGDGGYSIFYGPDKTFHHSNLHDHSLLSSLLDRKDVEQRKNVLRTDIRTNPVGNAYDNYAAKIEAHGFYLNLEMIDERIKRTLEGTKEGRRNQNLFVSITSAIEVGLDPTKYLDLTDLPEKEKLEVLDSAMDHVALKMTTFLDDVLTWRDTAQGLTHELCISTVEVIAKHAIIQHNPAPWISQTTVLVARI